MVRKKGEIREERAVAARAGEIRRALVGLTQEVRGTHPALVRM
jgi:hypothetical protein